MLNPLWFYSLDFLVVAIFFEIVPKKVLGFFNRLFDFNYPLAMVAFFTVFFGLSSFFTVLIAKGISQVC